MADLVDARVLRTVATSELGTLSAAKPEKGSCADRERPVGRQSGARLVLALDLATSGSVLADNVPRVSGMLTKILLFTSHPAHSPRGSGLFFLGLFLNGQDVSTDFFKDHGRDRAAWVENAGEAPMTV